MELTLNDGQQRIVDAACRWYHNSPEQVFQYAGNAGTGKSVVLNSIIQQLNLKDTEVAPMSFMGAAAIVMRTKGLMTAKTIHSWLYHPVQTVLLDKSGKVIMDEYLNRPKTIVKFEPRALNGIKLIVIDEAGMVPKSLKSEIESRGVKVLACGDLDQLPPVADTPGYLIDGEVHVLDELMRQSANSGIIYLAQRAKCGMTIQKGIYNNAIVIDQDELTDEMIAYCNIVLCGRNNTRDGLNTRIRHDILKYDSIIPNFGEKLICRKNNWKVESNGMNLANGLIGTISNQPDVSGFNGKRFNIDFSPDLLNSTFVNLPVDYKYFTAPSDRKGDFKYNKYDNFEKFEYAYCITTHLSQGSQYNRGIYMEEFLSKTISKNLNYTGITRFSDFLIYVKPKRRVW